MNNKLLTLIVVSLGFVVNVYAYEPQQEVLTQQGEVTNLYILVLAVVVIIIGFAVFKTFRGKAVFFASYGDLSLNLVPLAVFLLGLFNTEKGWSRYAQIISASSAIIYNYSMAFRYNSHHKFLAFCVGTGRIVLGCLIPLIIVFAYIFGGTGGKRAGETEEVYSMRRTIERAEALAIIAGLAYFLKKLVGYSANTLEKRKYWSSSRSKED